MGEREANRNKRLTFRRREADCQPGLSAGALMRRAICLVGALLFAGEAMAGFENWSVEASPDPFTGGAKVEVSYLANMRSGTFLICDSSKEGLELRVVAGWEYVDDLQGFKPTGKLAIDGKILFEVPGETGAFGSNVAGATFALARHHAEALAIAMEDATKQIAVQDGISDRPMLMKVRGSTKAGKALRECLVKQADGERSIDTFVKKDKEAASDTADQNAMPVDDVVKRAMFMIHGAVIEERCKGYTLKPKAKGYGFASDVQKRSIDELIAQEKARTASELERFSCAAAAHESMEWTDLPYDEVWQAP